MSLRIIAVLLTAILVNINLLKTFKDRGDRNIKEISETINRFIHFQNTRMISNTKIGKRVQHLLSENIQVLFYDKDTAYSLQSQIYAGSSDGQGVLLITNTSKDLKLCISKELKDSLEVFPFDLIYYSTDSRSIYEVFRYNHKISANKGTAFTDIFDYSLPIYFSDKNIEINLNPLIAKNESISLSKVTCPSSLFNNRLTIPISSVLSNNKDNSMTIEILNEFLWPVKQYIILIQKEQEQYSAKAVLVGAEHGIRHIDNKNTILYSNSIHKIYLSTTTNEMSSKNLFLPLSFSPEDYAIFIDDVPQKDEVIHLPSDKSSIKIKVVDNLTSLSKEWNCQIIRPKRISVPSDSRTLFITCSREIDKYKSAFKKIFETYKGSSSIEFLDFPEIAFCNISPFLDRINREITNGDYDQVILNIGANDILWWSQTWLDYNAIYSKITLFSNQINKWICNNPKVRFACIIPQFPSRGDAVYLQGNNINWRFKARAHCILSNKLYALEKKIDSSNFNVVPAFFNVTEEDYTINTKTKNITYLYSYFIKDSGYRKITENILTWAAYY